MTIRGNPYFQNTIANHLSRDPNIGVTRAIGRKMATGARYAKAKIGFKFRPENMVNRIPYLPGKHVLGALIARRAGREYNYGQFPHTPMYYSKKRSRGDETSDYYQYKDSQRGNGGGGGSRLEVAKLNEQIQILEKIDRNTQKISTDMGEIKSFFMRRKERDPKSIEPVSERKPTAEKVLKAGQEDRINNLSSGSSGALSGLIGGVVGGIVSSVFTGIATLIKTAASVATAGLVKVVPLLMSATFWGGLLKFVGVIGAAFAAYKAIESFRSDEDKEYYDLLRQESDKSLREGGKASDLFSPETTKRLRDQARQNVENRRQQEEESSQDDHPRKEPRSGNQTTQPRPGSIGEAITNSKQGVGGVSSEKLDALASTRGENVINPQEVYDYLRNEKNLTHEQAVGMMTNIQGESAFRSDAINNNANENGPSGGLFQHHDSKNGSLKRFTNMVNAAGPDWRTNWKGQIDHALSENEAKRYLQTKFNSGYDATKMWIEDFERPRDVAGAIAGRSSSVGKFNSLRPSPRQEPQQQQPVVAPQQPIAPVASEPQQPVVPPPTKAPFDWNSPNLPKLNLPSFEPLPPPPVDTGTTLNRATELNSDAQHKESQQLSSQMPPIIQTPIMMAGGGNGGGNGNRGSAPAGQSSANPPPHSTLMWMLLSTNYSLMG